MISFAKEVGFHFKLFRLIAQRAQSQPALRPLASAASRLRCMVRGGGTRLVPPELLLKNLLSEAGRTQQRPLDDYVAELRADPHLPKHMADCAEEKNHNPTKFRDWDRLIDTHRAQIALFYALTRELRPARLVETGTASGSMTAIVLAALARNDHGHLISIDLPPVAGMLTMDATVASDDVGFFIPSTYRSRWELRLGDAKTLLPQALTEAPVDLFIHDSLHTRSHMVFEYASARALMPANALILSDDTLWNNGFDDFLALNRLTGYAAFGNPNTAGFVNRFDAYESEIGTGIVRLEEKPS